MIVVLDSSVWISALQFGGPPKQALDTIFRFHALVSCTQINAEVERVLQTKFRWSSRDAAQSMTFYLGKSPLIPVTGSMVTACRDRNDDMVLECAILAGARVIVSGDKDLLTLNPYSGILVITPAAFLDFHQEPT